MLTVAKYVKIRKTNEDREIWMRGQERFVKFEVTCKKGIVRKHVSEHKKSTR